MPYHQKHQRLAHRRGHREWHQLELGFGFIVLGVHADRGQPAHAVSHGGDIATALDENAKNRSIMRHSILEAAPSATQPALY